MDGYPLVANFGKDINKNLNNYEESILNQFEEFLETKQINEEYLKNIDGNYENLIGLYYRCIEQDYDLMKQYYLMAIEKGNITSMKDVGDYYKNIEENYDLMKQYYLLAIEKGDISCMDKLGSYYKSTEKNYDLMKKYYLKAIEKDYSFAMVHLADYYRYIEQNYDLMTKYYLMAIDKGNICAMDKLGSYYKSTEKNYDLMKKYYLMSIEKNNYTNSLIELGSYYELIEKDYDLMKKYYFIGIEKKLGYCNFCLKRYMNSRVLENNDNNILEVLDLSNKINDFEVFNKIDENKIYNQFYNLENIDKIYGYLDKLTISDRLKKQLQELYQENFINKLNSVVLWTQLPEQLKIMMSLTY